MVSSSTTEADPICFRKRKMIMNEFTSMGQKRRFEALKSELKTNEEFQLTAPEGESQDEDSLGDLDTNEFIDDSRDEMEAYEGEDAIADDFFYEDDGQPDEYTEWQDVYGGDDWDHGQNDEY